MALDYLKKLYWYNAMPFGFTDKRRKFVIPRSDYTQYALSKAPGNKSIRMPAKGKVLELWKSGKPAKMYDIAKYIKSGDPRSLVFAHNMLSSGNPTAIENMYNLINSHTWMDKAKTTPTDADHEWMRKVHDQKVFNFFNNLPVDTNLPKPNTPEQEKMLPWVTQNKTKAVRPKVASVLKY